MTLQVALEHRHVDTLIVALIALVGLDAGMIPTMVLQMMFVFGDKRARVAGQHLLGIQMNLDVVPMLVFLGSFVATPLASEDLIFGHLSGWLLLLLELAGRRAFLEKPRRYLSLVRLTSVGSAD